MINKMLDEMAAEVIDTLQSTEEYYIPDEFIQKFGEKIIARCANAANSELACLDVYSKIKNYFGVEQ